MSQTKRQPTRAQLPTPGASDHRRRGEVEDLIWFYEIGYTCGPTMKSNFGAMVAACSAQKNVGSAKPSDEHWTTRLKARAGHPTAAAAPGPDMIAIACAERAAPIFRTLALLTVAEQDTLRTAFGPRGKKDDPDLPAFGGLTRLAFKSELARTLHRESKSKRLFGDWFVRLATGGSDIARQTAVEIRQEVERERAAALGAYRRAALRWQEHERARDALRSAARRELERAGYVFEEGEENK